MGPVAAKSDKEIAHAVVVEAIDEVQGKSNRKWGFAVLAFAIGVAVAVIVIRRRGGQLVLELHEPERAPNGPPEGATGQQGR